jgi:hypothetical protein
MRQPISELVAIFPDEQRAQAAVRGLTEAGIDPALIRIGDSLDRLAAIEGEMREEVNYVAAMPAPVTRESMRGTIMGAVIGGIVGLAVALPFAAFEIADLSLPGRLVLLGAIGALFGSFIGGFLAGAFAIERSDVPLAAQSGTTVAVAESERSRRALEEAGATRVDVVRMDGRAVDTEVTNYEGPVATARHIKDNARGESRRG